MIFSFGPPEFDLGYLKLLVNGPDGPPSQKNTPGP